MNQATTTIKSLHDFVPMRSCVGLIVTLTIPIIAIIFSLYKIGIDRNQYWLMQVDSFVAINSVFSPYTSFWFNLTQLGDAYILLPMMSFFILYKPQIWAAFFGAIPLATLLTHGGKAIASVPRPAAVLQPDQITVIGDMLTGHNSLPSGHTATVFVVGTVIMLTLYYAMSSTLRWWVVPCILTLTILLSISRVVVGAHWPLDVLFGAACGFLGGVSGIYLTQKYSGWWTWIKIRKYRRFFGFFILIWAVSLLPPLHSDGSASTIAQWIASFIGITCSLKCIFSPLKRSVPIRTRVYDGIVRSPARRLRSPIV